jgi:pilus assembly protein Flp/PilA
LKQNEEKENEQMLTSLKRFIQDEEAPTAVEYAIMVAGIAVVIISVVILLGKNVRDTLNTVAQHVPGPGTGTGTGP